MHECMWLHWWPKAPADASVPAFTSQPAATANDPSPSHTNPSQRTCIPHTVERRLAGPLKHVWSGGIEVCVSHGAALPR